MIEKETIDMNKLSNSVGGISRFREGYVGRVSRVRELNVEAVIRPKIRPRESRDNTNDLENSRSVRLNNNLLIDVHRLEEL